VPGAHTNSASRASASSRLFSSRALCVACELANGHQKDEARPRPSNGHTEQQAPLANRRTQSHPHVHAAISHAGRRRAFSSLLAPSVLAP
jgi:hypothetical protein